MGNRILAKTSWLRELAASALVRSGMPAEDVAVVVDSLIDAEVCGVESHGLMRLPDYLNRIERGLINARPDVKIERRGAVLRVDGDNGMGQVVAARAAEECVAGAKEFGVCFAAVRDSNHFGTASFFTRIAARKGCIGYCCTTAGPTVAPFGGMDKLLGTDPFSVAFPAGQGKNFVLDMAVSAVAKGKIRIYAQEGKKIPLGWAIDSEGCDTEDPEAAIKGILLPMGGHKGYGLALVVETLSGILSGAKLSAESESMFEGASAANIGHFIGAFDIAHFMELSDFEERAVAWFERLKGSKLRPGAGRIMIPGEPEELLRRTQSEELPILEKTYRALEALSR